MPRPPLVRLESPTSIGRNQDIEASTQDYLQEALHDVVREYMQKLSELSSLTVNLSKRLHIITDVSCDCASTCHHENTSTLAKGLMLPATIAPVTGAFAPELVNDHYNSASMAHPSHIGISQLADLAKENANPQPDAHPSHLDICQLAELAKESANPDPDGELRKEEEAESLENATPTGHTAIPLENRIETAVGKFDSLSTLDSLTPFGVCAKLLKNMCPEVVRTLRDVARRHSRRESNHLRDHMNKKHNTLSHRFDMLVGALILANCGSMMVQLEYIGYKSEITLGDKEDIGSWKNAEIYFTIVEHVFNALFILELFIRFAIEGAIIFCEGSIFLDIVLVLGTSIQIYILDPMEVNGIQGVNLSLFRLVRFAKFIKIFRLVRILKLFSHLRVLVKTIVSSFGALIWSMILLFMVMIMSGMILCGLLEDFITNTDNDLLHRKWVFKYYGTCSRAVYTLFEITLAGCWPNYLRPLIENVSPWYVLFAFVYISFVVFAIIRIITAIFLKETLTIAGNDAEMMLQERVRQKEIYVNKLQSVFQAVDVSGDGTLNLEEFSEIVQNPLVKLWLQLLELEVHDATALFRLLDNGDGEITYDEFLKGVMRLKGQARSTDIVAMMHSSDKTLNLVTKIMERVSHMLAKVDPDWNMEVGPEIQREISKLQHQHSAKSWLA